MSNPWLWIPLWDYESHMLLPTVSQAEMLAEQFSDALHQLSPESVAVIGCTGGNGFDRASPTTKRVVGVDRNPGYIAAASSRYLGITKMGTFSISALMLSKWRMSPFP